MKAISIFFLATLGIAIFPTNAQEDSPSPTPSPADSAPKSAFLRTWVMIPADVAAPILGDEPKLADNLSLTCGDELGKPRIIAKTLKPYSTNGYTEFTPSTRKIQLIRTSDKTFEVLASTVAALKAGDFMTAIVQKQNGRYSISIVDDTQKPPTETKVPGEAPPPPPKEIAFYNFLAGAAIPINSKEAGFSKKLIYGNPEQQSGLPAKIFTVQMPMRYKKRQYVGDVEVDLQTNNSLSFLIIQDLYGRTTAKVLTNGKLE